MTGSKMAKVGLREQNRLSGANRNTLIAGGIMANTAEIFNFPVPDVAQKEPRVADLDDGYTRIANELLEAVMLAGLTQHQLLVFLAVMRKTYGFNKKLDWVSNEQLSELTGILPHKCSAAKSVLVKRGIFIQSGRNIGINNVISEWSTLPESGKKNKVYLKEVNLPESGKKSLPKSGKGVYPNQVNTKDKLTKDNIKPFSSENSGESSDQPENDLPVEKPDAAIQSGSRWGTAEDLTAAEWMFDMVKTIAPSARKPNFAGWANDKRAPQQDASIIQHYTSPRHEHSRKPDCVREMLVRLLGNLPRIELFARKSSHGFDVWGNKCDSPTVSLSPARVTDVYS